MKRYAIMTENSKKNPIRKLLDKLDFRGALADGEGEGAEGSKEDKNEGEGDSKDGEDNTPDFSLLKDKKVSNLVQHARTEEKTKVHKDLDKAKAKNTALEGEVRSLTAQVGQLTVDNAKLTNDLAEAVKQAQLSADDKVKAVQEELTSTKADLAKVTGELSVVKSKLDATVLEGYKKSKIEEAGGKVIEELITGSTTEEIDASVEKAKLAYSKYAPTEGTTQTKPDSTTQTKPNSASTGATGAPSRQANEADFTGFTNMLKNPREAKKQASAYGEIRKKF